MKLFFFLVMVFSVLCSAGATWANIVPAESPEHPQGISLRDQSARPGFFFVGYRSHQGGGLHGGK